MKETGVVTEKAGRTYAGTGYSGITNRSCGSPSGQAYLYLFLPAYHRYHENQSFETGQG